MLCPSYSYFGVMCMVALTRTGGKRLKVERAKYFGYEFLLVTIPERRAERRAVKAARILKKLGVRYFVPFRNFTQAAAMVDGGIALPPMLPLFHEFAGDFALMLLEKMETKPEYAAIHAKECTRQVRRAAIALAQNVRYLLLDFEGAETVAEELMCVFGIAAVINPSSVQLSKSELTLCFTPMAFPAGKIIALFEADENTCLAKGTVTGASFILNDIRFQDLPAADFDLNRMAGALYSEKAVKALQVRPKDLLHLT